MKPSPTCTSALVLATCLTLALLPGQGVPHAEPLPDLPDRVEIPAPADRANTGTSAAPDEDTLPPAADAPVPTPRPAKPTETAEPEAPGDDEQPPIRTTAQTGLPGPERACRARLRRLGVAFSEHPPLSEPEGCASPYPLTVTSLGSGVKLAPEAVMNCAMTEASARFVRDHALPAARRHLDQSIDTVNHVSAYVCRPRNNQRRLSEHAFANALDWGAVTLEDETVIDVRAWRRGSPEGMFLAALRKAACGPFKTVLGPGSDADHADHFHFDLAERSRGATYCR